MLNRRIARRARKSLRPTPPLGPLELLEQREVPAILIQIDYSRDTTGFFTNNPEARATIERVASELGNSLTANLSAITPSGGNTWNATFLDPATGGTVSIPNMTIAANTITVFVGARVLPGSESGTASSAGHNGWGNQAWLNTLQTRGHVGYAPWGGSITFDSSERWHYGQTTDGLDGNELDFYSVASHEMGHVLGIGTSTEWNALISGGTFRGSNAMGVYGAAVPVSSDNYHWADGITLNGQAVALDPSLPYGQRLGFTALDAAALRDLGWNTASSGSAGPTPVTVLVGGLNGVVTQYGVLNGVVYPTGQYFTPFPGYRGAFHQAVADFDGDGVLDLAVAMATPGVGIMTIISGTDGHYLTAPRLTFGPVVAMIAADIDSDGMPDLITFEGRPMGAYVFNVHSALMLPSVSYSAFGVPGRAALHADDGTSSDGAAALALPPTATDPFASYDYRGETKTFTSPRATQLVPNAAEQFPAGSGGAKIVAGADVPLIVLDQEPDDSESSSDEEDSYGGPYIE